MARGSIRNRGKNTWNISVALGKDPATGIYKRKWETVHGTRREAEKRLAELLVELDRGTLSVSPKMTVATYLEQWLHDYVKPNLSATTYDRYRIVVQHQIVPYIGTLQLDKLKPAHLAHLLARLNEAPRSDGKPGTLATGTLQKVMTVLQSALRSAVKWQLISSNPATKIDKPSGTSPEMRAFTVEQAAAFLQAAKNADPQWHAFFTVAITTGLRLGELLGLRWSDLDLTHHMLRVAQTVQYPRGQGWIVKPPKTAMSRRQVVLGPDVTAILTTQKAGQNERRLLLGAEWHDHDLVFTSRYGEPLRKKAIYMAFERICALAGVPRIRIHDLRHTSATIMLVAGVHPKIVSERLGHSDISTTLKIYSHLTATLQQAAAETIDTLLRGENC